MNYTKYDKQAQYWVNEKKETLNLKLLGVFWLCWFALITSIAMEFTK